MGYYPWRLMSYKLANGMKMWKRYGNTTILLLFSLKGLEILHQEKRGQVKTMVMEYFNSILFHKSRPANKQHTNHSSTGLLSLILKEECKLRMFEKKTLRWIFGPKRLENGEWRRLCNEELQSLYSSLNIVWMFKSRRLRWIQHVCLSLPRGRFTS